MFVDGDDPFAVLARLLDVVEVAGCFPDDAGLVVEDNGLDLAAPQVVPCFPEFRPQITFV
jgi:hypothetical protein